MIEADNNYLLEVEKMRKANPVKEQGFTLLEVLAVVVIVGLMAGLVIPKYHQTIEHQQLRAMGDQLKNDIRYIQQRAMAEGGFFDIRFYPYANPPRYLIYKELQQIERKDMPKGITITSVNFPYLTPAPTLRFNYSGTPSTGGTVQLENSYGESLLIITTPVTARVRVEEQ